VQAQAPPGCSPQGGDQKSPSFGAMSVDVLRWWSGCLLL
jgi:hypothetical protein